LEPGRGRSWAAEEADVKDQREKEQKRADGEGHLYPRSIIDLGFLINYCSKATLQASIEKVGLQMQASSAGNIAKMLAALAVFGHSQRPLLGRLADAVVDRISEFSSVALADIVYAYAMLGTTSERLINAALQQVKIRQGGAELVDLYLSTHT
jgi:hypothetical protein